MMKKIITLIAIITLCLGAFSASAYTETSSNGNLIASVSPANPAPGDKVSISLRSLGFNVASSYAYWIVNGQAFVQGPGKTNMDFVAGPVGSNWKIDITLVTPDGEKITKTISFTVGSVKLLWQAAGHTPPFYQGKALATAGSAVKVVALPRVLDRSGKIIPGNQISYKWKIDGNVSATASGLGKDSFVYTAKSNGESTQISVIAEYPSTGTAAESSVVIVPSKPFVLFYENKPLIGPVFEKSISGNYNLSADEVTLRAEPYFFSVANGAKYVYSWLINGEKVSGRADNPAEITLRKKEGTEGVSRVSLSANSSTNKKDSASTSLLIRFSGSNTFNFQ